jgi:hypothetical protein
MNYLVYFILHWMLGFTVTLFCVVLPKNVFFFVVYWHLNSEFHTCEAGALPFESRPQHFLALILLDSVLSRCFAQRWLPEAIFLPLAPMSL